MEERKGRITTILLPALEFFRPARTAHCLIAYRSNAWLLARRLLRTLQSFAAVLASRSKERRCRWHGTSQESADRAIRAQLYPRSEKQPLQGRLVPQDRDGSLVRLR